MLCLWNKMSLSLVVLLWLLSSSAVNVRTRSAATEKELLLFTTQVTQQSTQKKQITTEVSADTAATLTGVPTLVRKGKEVSFSGSTTVSDENKTISLDISSCLRHNGSLQLTELKHVHVFYQQTGSSDATSKRENQTCSVNIHPGQENTYLNVNFVRQTCTRAVAPVFPEAPLPVWREGNGSEYLNTVEVTLVIVLYGKEYDYSQHWTGCESLTLDQFMPHVQKMKKVMFTITVTDVSIPYALRINVTAVPESKGVDLDLRFLSPTLGYIDSQSYAGVTRKRSHHAWATIDIPSDHHLMVSFMFIAMRCYERWWVELYVDGKTASDLVWKDCGSSAPATATYDAHRLHVHSAKTSERRLRYLMGFRLIFSFHQRSAVPVRLTNGQWNCSVPHWPNFRHHLRCNMEVECSGGEDEVACGYDLCDGGGVMIGDRCYVFRQPKAKLSWVEANDECSKTGGHLASLNTQAELRDFEDIVHTRKWVLTFIGIRTPSSNPEMYGTAYMWEDNSILYFPKVIKPAHNPVPPLCGHIQLPWEKHFRAMSCTEKQFAYFWCELRSAVAETPAFLRTAASKGSFWVETVTCPDGHLTHRFLLCDQRSACYSSRQLRVMTSASSPTMMSCPVSFPCANGMHHVPYTLVCDFRSDCKDGSDETFCVHPACSFGSWECGNKQCYVPMEQCDGISHCLNGADEAFCTWIPDESVIELPAIIEYDGKGGRSNVYNKSEAFLCPETHFLCPGQDQLCLPVYVRCNGVYDCAGHEDEAGCGKYSCPGLYRCMASRICVYPQHVCDDIYQCPQRDDELLCNFTCPKNCTCYGLSFTCNGSFPVQDYPELRYLDAKGSEIRLEDVDDNQMLVFLSLADCNLTSLENVSLPNLRQLDLSDNRLKIINRNTIQNLSNLQILVLQGNPLSQLFREDGITRHLPDLLTLDLSRVPMLELDLRRSVPFPALHTLNLSAVGLTTVQSGGFKSLISLRILDLRGCPLPYFDRETLRGNDKLRELYVDNHKLCCPSVLPVGFNPNNCHAQTSDNDDVSSCDTLLRSDFYRFVLCAVAIIGLTGNLGSFVFRVCVSSSKGKSGFSVFVSYLCVADFLMGVYLAMIGVADYVYQGSYIWEDVRWRNSAVCSVAGFLSLVSSEVSAFIICLVTVDRFLVLRFPFTRLRFGKLSAHVTCLTVFVVGLILATIPLLPVAAHWKFYSSTEICIPLPISRRNFVGHDYSFGLMIILNFLLFVLIAVGQLSIYSTVRSSAMTSSESTHKIRDISIARRLVSVVVSDFLCWFPIGLLGILASQDRHMPGVVNVAMAVCVVPINSALNPFLYTMNMFLDRRRQRREQIWEKLLMDKIRNSSLTL